MITQHCTYRCYFRGRYSIYDVVFWMEVEVQKSKCFGWEFVPQFSSEFQLLVSRSSSRSSSILYSSIFYCSRKPMVSGFRARHLPHDAGVQVIDSWDENCWFLISRYTDLRYNNPPVALEVIYTPPQLLNYIAWKRTPYMWFIHEHTSVRTAARTYSTQTRTDAQTLLHTRSNTPLRCGSAVTIQHSIR